MNLQINQASRKVDGWVVVSGVTALNDVEQSLLKSLGCDVAQNQAGEYTLTKDYFPAQSLLRHLLLNQFEGEVVAEEVAEFNQAIKIMVDHMLDSDEDLLNYLLKTNAVRTGQHLVAIGAILRGEDQYSDVVNNYFPDGRFVQKHELVQLTREELLSTHTLYQYLTTH